VPKIAQGLRVAIELLLIESGGLFEHGGRVGWRSALLLEVSEALAEGQMAGQLDKSEGDRRPAAAVTVKEIFAGADIERRPGFRVQRTESDELGAVTSRPGGPILPAADNQVAAGAVLVFRHPRPRCCFASGDERRRTPPAFPGNEGGSKNFLRDAEAKGFAEPESAKTKLRDSLDRRVPANDRRR